jgi:hypothetical protein
MVQDAVVAHGKRRLDAQAVDNGADACGRRQPLERQALDGDIVDLGLNGSRALSIDLKDRRLEMRPDPGFAADRGKRPLAQILGFDALLQWSLYHDEPKPGR